MFSDYPALSHHRQVLLQATLHLQNVERERERERYIYIYTYRGHERLMMEGELAFASRDLTKIDAYLRKLARLRKYLAEKGRRRRSTSKALTVEKFAEQFMTMGHVTREPSVASAPLPAVEESAAPPLQLQEGRLWQATTVQRLRLGLSESNAEIKCSPPPPIGD